MNKREFEKIIRYIVDRGAETIKNKTDEAEFAIDYVAIFSKNKDEFNKLKMIAENLGDEVDKTSRITGFTYLLKNPLKTPYGLLKLVKVRFPDPTRAQRGAPDFKVSDYHGLKNKYIRSSGDFTLMLKEEYEMVEIKGVDVLVYIPDKTLGERINT